jgi:predicted Fe-Mo cluster-binding NifX family protein
MKIVISSQGEDLEAAISPVFGRCPTFLFVDTETGQFEAVANPAISQGGGAGVQAAQFVVEHGAQAVLSGNLGPNAFDVLLAAEVPGYLVSDGTVGQAVEAFKAGRLQPMTGANVPAHAGMGRGAGRRMSRRGGLQPPPQAPPESELAQLRETLKDLRQQLAETMDKIDQLEKEA